MLQGPFLDPVSLLYYLCAGLLLVLPLYVIASRGGRRASFPIRLLFLFLSLSLLLWQTTLFLEARADVSLEQLWLGRLNFASIAFASYLSFRFVREAPTKKPKAASSLWLLAETASLAILTLLTPLVSVAERVVSEHPVTTYGPLFPLYLAHVGGYFGAALLSAFRERRREEAGAVREQLTLIAYGMLATGGVAFVTNALLPYAFGNFDYDVVGALSTLFFVLAIAYATFVHGLFDLRVILRAALVYGVLLTFVLGAYGTTVFVVTQYVTGDAGNFTRISVLLIAFSFDPFRRLLERKIDRLLFRRPRDNNSKEERRKLERT